MKTTRQFRLLAALLLTTLTAPLMAQDIKNALFRIAPAEYGTLAEKSILTLGKFDFAAWGAMLADDVEYDFPDGDQNTRTKLKGKTAVLTWWKNWQTTSGTKAMTMTDFNTFPLDVYGTTKGGAAKGFYAFTYFTNKQTISGKPVSTRMNFAIHFNAGKKIDRYITYYDRTAVIKALGRNLLEKATAKK